MRVVFPTNVFSKLAEDLLSYNARRVTKYLAKDLVVTATRRVYGGKIDRRDTRTEILFKAGRPNYRERQFIKLCIKAGEPFPIKRTQICRFKDA